MLTQSYFYNTEIELTDINVFIGADPTDPKEKPALIKTLFSLCEQENIPCIFEKDPYAENGLTLSLKEELRTGGVLILDDLRIHSSPKAVFDFIDALTELSQASHAQIFIFTSDYLVLKKLALIGLKWPQNVTCIALLQNDSVQVSQGISSNFLFNAAIDLYEEEIDQSLDWDAED